MSAYSCCKRCFIAIFVIVVFVLLIHGWLTYKSYVFSHKTVASIAVKYAAPKDATAPFDVKKAYQNVHRELSAKYPGHILPESELQWVFLNAGGFMVSVCIAHASLTENIFFFGTAIETSGHSGRFWGNISHTLLVGELRVWKEGEFTAVAYKPGSFVYHEWGSVAGAQFRAGTWTVEYTRGFVPSTLLFPLGDAFFSTLDFITVFRMMHLYMRALLFEAGYYVTHVKELFA